MNQNQNKFHPSMFETTAKDVPGRDLVVNERKQPLTNVSLEILQSPGRFNLTDADNNISGSNTRYLFKNLYGETPLTFLFFSNRNVENIQKMIRYIVHRETGYVVDKQSTNELLVIMRSLFLEYSAHPPLIDADMSQERIVELQRKYTEEVGRLNEIVVNAVVPKVVSQMQQYVDYLRDISTQPYQMQTPKNSSVTGERKYRSTTQILLGGDL